MKWLGALLLMLGMQGVQAADLFGSVDAISGEATVSSVGVPAARLSAGQQVYVGQTIVTQADGEVHLVAVDGTIIAVRPNSTFRVDAYQAEGNSSDKIVMSLLKGAIRSITGWIGKYNRDAYRLETPSATIGIRGTDHETTVIEEGNGDEAGTYDTVTEGGTVIRSAHGEVQVQPGKFAFAARQGVAAPRLLERLPAFWARRSFKLEQRIEQRKAAIRSRLEQLRNERINKLRKVNHVELQQKRQLQREEGAGRLQRREVAAGQVQGEARAERRAERLQEWRARQAQQRDGELSRREARRAEGAQREERGSGERRRRPRREEER